MNVVLMEGKCAEQKCVTEFVNTPWTFTWTITNFSFWQKTFAGKQPMGMSFLKSSTYTSTEASEWQLRIEPVEIDELLYDEDPVRFPFDTNIHLDLISEKPVPPFLFQFYVINNKGQKVHFAGAGSEHPVDRSWAVMQYITVEMLQEEQLLIDDTLTIGCEIRLLKDITCTPIPAVDFSCLENNQLADDLDRLLDDETSNDVTFSLKGQLIKAHKCILAARSSVFKAMFQHDMTEKLSNVVSIEDIDSDVFRQMLRFIYTNKAPSAEANVGGLLNAAERYNLQSLKLFCLASLYRNLSAENAVEALILADLHSVVAVKNCSIAFIKAHLSCVMKTADWKSMIQGHPKLFAEIFQN